MDSYDFMDNAIANFHITLPIRVSVCLSLRKCVILHIGSSQREREREREGNRERGNRQGNEIGDMK